MTKPQTLPVPEASQASLRLVPRLAVRGGAETGAAKDKLRDRLWSATSAVYTSGTPTTAAAAAAFVETLRPKVYRTPSTALTAARTD